MVNLKSESIDRLFEAILGLKNTDDCYKFFEDVCTIKELKDMAQRLDVAFLLTEGVNYLKIAEEINVSTATISRVNKCLNYGNGGYKEAIEKIKKKQQ